MARVPAGLTPPDAPAWRLDAPHQGTLEHLALVPAPAATGPLASGQVRIAVRAGGLNFRDVLYALGMYPDEMLLGGEGAGVVTEVGPGVSRFAPGDQVFGLVPGCLGPVAVVDARVIAPIPAGWTFAEAAAVPIVFLTAYYGLVDLARVRPGETVLVHAAAGGVGMAAVQIARHLGAEVYGTASPAKWAALDLDPAHLASSRTTGFEDSFRGAGMDVVLNSLAREYVDASARLLRPGGRFVEMGKTDVRDGSAFATEHPGTTYRAFDLMEAGPERIQEMLGELLGLFDRGVLRRLPLTTWDVRDAVAAFRYVSQARHVGKVALTIPRPLDPAGTVLVTGATGTLGGLVARHLVTAHHVRHLLLAGRRGLSSAGTAELAAELTALGATVAVTAADVTDRAAVATLLAAVPAEHPLTGVVHAAGVLADGVLTALTPGDVEHVFAPKVDAGWHLHELTRGLDLSMFVLFSSATSMLGGAGQANYAGANGFLDGLAQHRRAAGLPATSLAWGLWAQASGMTAGLTDTDRDRLARGGVGALSSAEGLALLDAALARPEPVLVPMRVEPAALRASTAPVPVLLRGLVRRPVQRAAAAPATILRDRIRGLTGRDRTRLVLDTVRTQAAAVLGHASADAVPSSAAFTDLGFDSLTSVELRNRLDAATGLRLPATMVFDHPTPADLSGYLEAELVPAAPTEHPDDAELRHLLDTLPTERLRAAGLLAVLRDLAAGVEPRSGSEDLIDALDAESLVRMALDGVES